MSEQRSAPEDESAAFFSDLKLEAPYPSDTSYPNSLDIPGQPSGGDPWFPSTHNLPHSWSDNNSSYPPYNPAGYGSSPGVSNSPWPGYEHSVEANSNNPTYYPNSPSYAIADQLSPSEQAFYNTNGNASVVGDPTLPLNYHRQPELLYPSAPSVPSAPSATSDGHPIGQGQPLSDLLEVLPKSRSNAISADPGSRLARILVATSPHINNGPKGKESTDYTTVVAAYGAIGKTTINAIRDHASPRTLHTTCLSVNVLSRLVSRPSTCSISKYADMVQNPEDGPLAQGQRASYFDD
ncbi:hypothetical protein PFICI_14119 [Pestalotiopsis fici W106-1]|uniref:Uncharacterized protein n=1 Tax=Pestalotiopsis fici (strain W106-1 / CGMCC3.15140) TaxID=1229662 RepID=W3WK81_PESFW|nr:uncharacterized protein PFICI_14119 [Pestalotiopsis fici W106-1]ETS74253.1 hypothetical protein PFICI_14119 [Pestalotiopsis fici W106-1]